MYETILSLAEAIAAPSEQEKPLLSALCRAAEAELAGQLRTTPEACGSAFPCAAALLAVSGFLPCRGGGEIQAFRAGELSISGGGSGASAELRSQAARLIAPYCGDGQFAFLGVKG